MSPKPRGANLITAEAGNALLEIEWQHADHEQRPSLYIVHPISRIERFLITKNRLTTTTLKRVSVTAYALIPALIFLNTVIPQVPQIPYLAVLITTLVLLTIAVAGGLWFYLGFTLLDRLVHSPLDAMRAPAVIAPTWWLDDLDELSPLLVSAYQRAWLARAVALENISEGERLQGRFLPSQSSSLAIEVGLAHLRAHLVRLDTALAEEEVSTGHARQLLALAEEPGIPVGAVDTAVARDVSTWAHEA